MRVTGRHWGERRSSLQQVTTVALICALNTGASRAVHVQVESQLKEHADIPTYHSIMLNAIFRKINMPQHANRAQSWVTALLMNRCGPQSVDAFALGVSCWVT